MSIIDFLVLLYVAFLTFCTTRLSNSLRAIFKSAYFDVYTTSLIFECIHLVAALVTRLILIGDFPPWTQPVYTYTAMLVDNVSLAMLLSQLVLSFNRYTAVAWFFEYRVFWSNSVVRTTKLALWIVTASSHFYMLLWGDLKYMDGFLIGYGTTIERVTQWYSICANIIIGVPSLVLDTLTILTLRDMRHEYGFLAWHNIIKNIALVPSTIYHVSTIMQSYCTNCPIFVDIARSLRWVEAFGPHTSIFVMLAFSHDVRLEIFNWKVQRPSGKIQTVSSLRTRSSTSPELRNSLEAHRAKPPYSDEQTKTTEV